MRPGLTRLDLALAGNCGFAGLLFHLASLRHHRVVRVAGNGNSTFKRLITAIGRDDLGTAPDLARNAGRVDEIDGAIEAWTQPRTLDQVLAAPGAARVPAGKVYTARDIHEDLHYRARDMILRQPTRDGRELDVPGIVPKLSATPGGLRRPAPPLGGDTDAVLREMGLGDAQIHALRRRGVAG